MAVEVASLRAVLDLDNQKFQKGMKASNKSMDGAQDEIRDLIEALDKLTKALGGVGDEAGDAFEDIEAGADNASGGVSGLFSALNPGALAITGITAVAGAIAAIGVSSFNAARDYDDAQRQIQARTGATGQALDDLGNVAKEVYGDNWGDSMADAADAVIQVNQVLDQTGDAAAQSARQALILRDVFGIEINESLRAVNSAVAAMGTDSQTVFDLMARTIQRVGDPADDLADTVNEYSIIFAQAGVSAEKMFAILEAGVQGGARNFDVVADTFKEFIIRANEGSEEFRMAAATILSGGEDFSRAANMVKEVEAALDRNEAGLQRVQEEWNESRDVVKDWERALADAKRQLDEFTRPNLAGMGEFDDQLFNLEQQSKKAQLALIGLEPDSAQFERGQAALDAINDQIDRLTLQRDIQFEPQLRALEKAAKEGTEEVFTYSQAMQRVADQKDNIADIESNLAGAREEWAEAGKMLDLYNNSNAILNQHLAETQAQFNAALAPADALLQRFQAGDISGDELFTILAGGLENLTNANQQAQAAIGLTGTKAEDVTAQVLIAMANAKEGVDDFSGAVDAAGNAVGEGLGGQMSQLWRDIEMALLPLGQMMIDALIPAIQQLTPVISKFANDVVPVISANMQIWGDVLTQIGQALGITNEEVSVLDVAIGTISLLLDGIIVLMQMWTTVTYGIKLALEALATPVNWMIDNLSAFGNALASLQDKVPDFSDMTESLKDLKNGIPDWLVPGSPTPLEIGLRGITGALGDFQTAMPTTAAAAVPAGGGGNLTLNMGGQAFNFDNNESGQNEALMTVLQLLRGQLEQR